MGKKQNGWKTFAELLFGLNRLLCGGLGIELIPRPPNILWTSGRKYSVTECVNPGMFRLGHLYNQNKQVNTVKRLLYNLSRTDTKEKESKVYKRCP